MAEYNRLQNSFATGYLDPTLYGFFTADAYNTGLKKCLNFIPSSLGYLYRRPGTKFLDFPLPSTATENKLYAMSTDNGPLLYCVSEGRIDFFSVDLKRVFYIENGTQYSSNGDKCSIPWSADDIASISLYEFEREIYVVHPSYPPHKITIVAQGNFELSVVNVYDDDGNKLKGTEKALETKDPELLISDIFIANAFYCQKVSFKKGGIESFSKAGHYPSCQTFKGGRWYLAGCNDSPSTIYASRAPDVNGDYRFNDFTIGNYYIVHLVVSMTKTTIYEDNESAGSIESVKYSANTTTDEEVRINGVDSEIPESTSSTQYTRCSRTENTDGSITWTKLDGGDIESPVEQIKAQTQKLEVTTVSETWTLKSDIQNDDAIELTESDMYGTKINWLITQQRVIAGSNRSIWMDTGAAATPSTFDLVKTLGVTTSNITPVIHSSMIIFVPADMKSVKGFNYDTDAEGYVMTDISATARSLFRNSKIKDMVVIEGRESILWVLLDNGKLLSCTLGSTYGWAEHELGGDGKVISMSQYHTNNNEGEIFFTVQRGDRITVEMLLLEDIVNTDVYTLCDCSVSLDKEGNEQDLSALSNNDAKPFAEGDEVQIVAGGWPRASFEFKSETVDVGPGSMAGIYIGYAYKSSCHMLWQELPVSSGQTSLGLFRKAISMAMQVYRSAGAECGWISGNKKHLDTFQRLAKANMEEKEYVDYYTGIVKLPVPSNTDEQVNAVVECSYPLPMTIQAIETRYILQEV